MQSGQRDRGDRLYSLVNAAYGGRIDGISPGAYVLPSKSRESPVRKPFAENSLARGIRTGSKREEESVQKPCGVRASLHNPNQSSVILTTVNSGRDFAIVTVGFLSRSALRTDVTSSRDIPRTWRLGYPVRERERERERERGREGEREGIGEGG